MTPFERIQKDNKRSPRFNKNAMAVGKTTFAERVSLFESLGDMKPSNGADDKDDPLQDHDAAKNGQTWFEVAENIPESITHSPEARKSSVLSHFTILSEDQSMALIHELNPNEAKH